ncbi:oligosaccharide flippase family protein [Thalassomonas sp. RHCl1]|uniref:oligosaccharide flippase family protein n=1 Tax=Thalassomonas sp. RHCl1 TaxID=2995320 RepID=UPI00248CD7C7|nr:oligosaccharide flippase family protein [Thalassomonas sp. RHCl1]
MNLINKIKLLPSRFWANPDNKEILSASAVILTFKVFTAVTGFLVSVVITRALGTTVAGYYFFMLSAIALLGSISRLGLDQAIVRFMAVANAGGERGKIKLIFSWACRWTLCTSLLMSALLYVFCQFFYARVFNDGGYLMPLLIACLVLPLSNLFTVILQSFQGVKQIVSFAWLNGVERPINLLGLLFIIFVFGAIELEQALLTYLLVNVLVALLGYFLWQKYQKETTERESILAAADIKVKLWHSSMSLWGVACLSIVMGQGAQLLTGFLSSPEQVTYFAVANRVALLVAFMLLAVNGILSPKFAELKADNRSERLQSVYRSSTGLMLLLTTPFMVLVFIFAQEILWLFGNELQPAVKILRLLIAAQFVKVAVGSVGQLLIMSGFEHSQRRNLLLAVAILVLVATLLIPVWGALGAAIAVFCAMSFNNVLGLWQVYKKLNIRLF